MSEFAVRKYVSQYLKQHIYITCIQFTDNDEFCKKLFETMVTVFLTSNSDLEHVIRSSLERERPNKKQQRTVTWRKRIRAACVAYCNAVYETLDTADVFLQSQSHLIDCTTAFTNQDCFIRSAESAKIMAEKNDKLSGFRWFHAA